ncbi:MULTISPECIES: META and DUF4377 domain-containing protein [unclassified Acinetobacter]|uniref:META and DUF4377 domain-containing protein n=1 Tax=unclassified Acinetobacter TaxID=196816 RepID=UPI00190D7AF3|nr:MULTISPECIES: META and DUF4377 domain-containing protein [unclassified Acinetobacter]MBK0063771.1 META and DUF4377 domain-containing protein [Acinetobacter sp. S55]MBK0066940.1 META and DUF4377 domain-containing protein [Acinetobacter sp. S54]
MKIRCLILALLPFSIVACQSVQQTSAPAVIHAEKQMNANKILSAYTWSYQPDGTPRPVQLNFSENRLSIITGCNNQGGSWKIENNQLITSSLVSTMKACEPALMKNERFASGLLSDQKNKFELNTSSIEQPTLTITASNGQQYEFKGTMTPETKYQSQGEIIFLEIAPETKQCTGVAPQTCLQVREIKYDGKGIKTQVDKDWTLFYDQIEGYQHRDDQRVIIRVKRYERKNPAADQSKYAYVHDMTVEQEMVKKP